MKNKIPEIFRKILWILSLAAAVLPQAVSAHENYVLTKNQINSDVTVSGINVFNALLNPGNLKVALSVAFFSLLAIVAYFFFQHSKPGRKLDEQLNRLEPVGQVILRLALAMCLLASAHFSAFLGPEIPLTSIPLGLLLKPLLYLLGLMLLFGWQSEIVGAVSLAVLLLATWVYKDYMLTYFNYFGEFVALMFFGSHVLSVDGWRKKSQTWAKQHRNLETAIVRVTYGLSIMYPAISFKLLHPQVIIDIVNRYHLNQFHWLFPHDALLISLGTGLAQVAVGLCLIFGFETRLNSAVTFVLLALSVIFFKEAVWPHYVLLALALYLFINNGGEWSLDHYLGEKKERLKFHLLRRLA